MLELLNISLNSEVHFCLVDTGSDLSLVDNGLVYKQAANFKQDFIPMDGCILKLGDGESKMSVRGHIRVAVRIIPARK